MGTTVFGDELTVEPRTCPLGKLAVLFAGVAEGVGDDLVARVARDGLPYSLLMSIPAQNVTVASCQNSIIESPIRRVRPEVRPGSEAIASLTDLTMDPESVTDVDDTAHRGGQLDRYCGSRADGDLDAKRVDLDRFERALLSLPDDVIRELGP